MSKPADPVQRAVQSNAEIFRVYSRRLSNPADQDIFITSAKKLAVFLSNERAYYVEAQQPVVELLEISLNSLKNVAPDVFRKSGSIDRSLIPAEQAPLFDAFYKLANSVTPYVNRFEDKSLGDRLLSFLSSVGIALSPEMQDSDSPDASIQTSAPRSARPQATSTASQAIAPTSSTNTASSTTKLPVNGGASTPVSASAPSLPVSSMTVDSPSVYDLEEAASPASVEEIANYDVVSTPIQQALHSSASVRQSPLSHAPASGRVVSTAPVEPNLLPQATPPLSATLPSTLSSLRIRSLSPVSDPQVAPIPLQKIAPSPSANRLDVPVSAPPTNIPQGPKIQAVPLSSKHPPLDGAARAPQNVLLSLARAHASGSAPPVPVSSPSIQQNPKPPSRVDFLQLDLQAAREKKQRAAAAAARPGSVTHMSSPTSSMSERATPAATPTTSIPVAITGAPRTPSLSSPTTFVVAQGTPPLISPILRTPPVIPPTAISSESDGLSALQPQNSQTAASRPIHRDLRQRSNRSGSGTPGTPRLQITDRGPAPPPEPGSLAAPIVIDEDEDEDEPLYVSAEDKMEIDAPVEALPNVEANSVTMLDLQDSRGNEDSAERNPKNQPQQEESVASNHLPEKYVSAPASQSTSRVFVPDAEPPAASAPVSSAQKPPAPLTTGPFSPLPTSSRVTSALAPSVSTPGSEAQKAHGVNGGKGLLNADVNTATTLDVAETKPMTATLARDGDGEKETMEISVECGGVAVVSGATIEKPSSSESTLDKVSSPTAVRVMAAPEIGNAETTPSFAPPATAPIAATDEVSPELLDEIMRILLRAKPSELGPSVDPQPPAGEHADASPTRGKRPRSPTPNGDIRRVFPRKSSPVPIAGRQQDLPATPVLSKIAQPQPITPHVTISHVVLKRETEDASGGITGPSSLLGPSIYQEPLTPSLSIGKHSSLSDMDISRSSISPPPIVVLKTEGASGTNSSDSRSVSPSGRKPSEARTVTVGTEGSEESEMVDELAPLFGKEMRVLDMFRPYDTPGDFTLDFVLVDAEWDKISLWVKAPENIDLDISQARCISLACYSVQDLAPSLNQQDASREHWFENARPVPWPKLPRHLWFLINDEFTILYPPYEAEEDLFDLSRYLRPGQNKIAFTQIDTMVDYVLVLHGHYPTRDQIAPVRERWDERKRFREQLAWLARPISPTL